MRGINTNDFYMGIIINQRTQYCHYNQNTKEWERWSPNPIFTIETRNSLTCFLINHCNCTDQCPVLGSIFICSILLHHEGPTRFFCTAKGLLGSFTPRETCSVLGLCKPGPITLVRLGPKRMMGTQSNFIIAPFKRYICVVDIISLFFTIFSLLQICRMFLLHICYMWLVAINPSNIGRCLGNRKWACE